MNTKESVPADDAKTRRLPLRERLILFQANFVPSLWGFCTRSAFGRIVTRMVKQVYAPLVYLKARRGRILDTDNPPRIVGLELTNRCPMRCVMCPRTQHMTRPLGDMAYDVFVKVIDEYAPLLSNSERLQRLICLHGFGESLLHPEFNRCIAYATSKGMRVLLSVNPLVLTEDRADKLLSSGVAALIVSMDGCDDESFAAIRGVSNAYEESKKRLFHLLAEKEAKRLTFPVYLQILDLPPFRRQTREGIRFWEGEKRVKVIVKPPINWNGSCDDVNFVLGRSRLERMPSRIYCNAPWNGQLSVLWNGDVVPCCNDFNGIYVLGNVTQQSLSDIWHGGRMRKLREEFISGHVTNALCRNCLWLRSIND